MLTKANEWRAEREAGRRQSLATARMLVGIRGIRHGEPYGEVAHCRMSRPVTYSSIRELVLRVDGIGEKLRVPDGTGGNDKKGPPGAGDGILSVDEMLREGFPRDPGLPAGDEVIRLELLGRRHGGLQGILEGRLTGGEDWYFRSTRELITALREICGAKTWEELPAPEVPRNG